MTIEAVNTLEIRLLQDPGQPFGAALDKCVALFPHLSGCLSYSVRRCDVETPFWIVCGHWRTEPDMHEHFASAEMTGLVNLLIGVGAHVVFTRLVPLIELAPV